MPRDSSHLLVADGFILLYPEEAAVLFPSRLPCDVADILLWCFGSQRGARCVIRALSPAVIAVSALTGMSPTKALVKNSHKHWVRIKGSRGGLVEKVCCGFFFLYVLFFRLSVQE